MCVTESMPMQCIQKSEPNSKKPGGSSKKTQGGKGSNSIAATKVHFKGHKLETGGGSGRKHSCQLSENKIQDNHAKLTTPTPLNC